MSQAAELEPKSALPKRANSIEGVRLLAEGLGVEEVWLHCEPDEWIGAGPGKPPQRIRARVRRFNDVQFRLQAKDALDLAAALKSGGVFILPFIPRQQTP